MNKSSLIDIVKKFIIEASHMTNCKVFKIKLETSREQLVADGLISDTYLSTSTATQSSRRNVQASSSQMQETHSAVQISF